MARTSEGKRCARVGLELSLQLFTIHKSVCSLAFVDFAENIRCWPVFVLKLLFIFSCRRWVCWRFKGFQVFVDATGMSFYVFNNIIQVPTDLIQWHFPNIALLFCKTSTDQKTARKVAFHIFMIIIAFFHRLPLCSAILFSIAESTSAFTSKPYRRQKGRRFIQKKFSSHVDCNIFATTICFHNSISPLSHFAGFSEKAAERFSFSLSSFYYFPFNEMRKWRRLKRLKRQAGR